MGYKWNPFTGTLDYVADAAITVEDALSAKTLILEKIASENVSALKALYLDTNTTCRHASNVSEIEGTVIGIALNSAIIGGNVRILVFGLLDDPFFNFTLNDRIFLGTNGELINYQPVSGVLTGIGYGLGSGSIQISIDKPTIL